MTEKHTAGVKEAVFAVLWAVAILIGYDFADTAMRLYSANQSDSTGGIGGNMALTIAAILAGCVLVYFVLTRYASVFIYDADKKSIRLTRKIGHRERVVEVKYKNIISFSEKIPENPPKPVHKMRKTVFSNKNTYYLIYKNGSAKETVIFEPSRKLAEEISSKMKEG